jgi:hypothetical protein
VARRRQAGENAPPKVPFKTMSRGIGSVNEGYPHRKGTIMGLQNGWRWCSRCQVLVFAGFGNGTCWDGEPHYLNDSDDYSLMKDDEPEDLQHGWRWCSRCQVLGFSGFNNGICWDEQPHYFADSGAYSLSLTDTVPPRSQGGWRWCSRCQVLVYSGFDDGICSNGEPHDLSNSGPYNVLKGVQPGLPGPTLRVTEQNWNIEVEGDGYTPNRPVALAFVDGSKVKQVPLTADDQGTIYYYERDTRAGGGLVIARDDSAHSVAFAGTEIWFPRVPGGPFDL